MFTQVMIHMLKKSKFTNEFEGQVEEWQYFGRVAVVDWYAQKVCVANKIRLWTIHAHV